MEMLYALNYFSMFSNYFEQLGGHITDIINVS